MSKLTILTHQIKTVKFEHNKPEIFVAYNLVNKQPNIITHVFAVPDNIFNNPELFKMYAQKCLSNFFVEPTKPTNNHQDQKPNLN